MQLIQWLPCPIALSIPGDHKNAENPCSTACDWQITWSASDLRHLRLLTKHPVVCYLECVLQTRGDFKPNVQFGYGKQTMHTVQFHIIELYINLIYVTAHKYYTLGYNYYLFHLRKNSFQWGNE